jgi:hypothetical protein
LQVTVTGRGGEAGEVARGELSAKVEPGRGATGLSEFAAAIDVFERGVWDEVWADGGLGEDSGVLCEDVLTKKDQDQEDRADREISGGKAPGWRMNEGLLKWIHGNKMLKIGILDQRPPGKAVVRRTIVRPGDRVSDP